MVYQKTKIDSLVSLKGFGCNHNQLCCSFSHFTIQFNRIQDRAVDKTRANESRGQWIESQGEQIIIIFLAFILP